MVGVPGAAPFELAAELLEGGAFASDHGRHQELNLLFWYHWSIVAVISSTQTSHRVDGHDRALVSPFIHTYTDHLTL